MRWKEKYTESNLFVEHERCNPGSSNYNNVDLTKRSSSTMLGTKGQNPVLVFSDDTQRWNKKFVFVELDENGTKNLYRVTFADENEVKDFFGVPKEEVIPSDFNRHNKRVVDIGVEEADGVFGNTVILNGEPVTIDTRGNIYRKTV